MSDTNEAAPVDEQIEALREQAQRQIASLALYAPNTHEREVTWMATRLSGTVNRLAALAMPEQGANIPAVRDAGKAASGFVAHHQHMMALAAAPKAQAQGGEVEKLRAALHYVAFALHGTPLNMLATGITLHDNDRVTVKVGDISVDTGRLAEPFKLFDAARAPQPKAPPSVGAVDRRWKDGRQTTAQLFAAAQRDSDAVSVFEDGSEPGEADRAIIVVKGRENIDYLRSLCERQGLLTDKPVEPS